MRVKTRKLIDILNEIDKRFLFIVDGVLNMKLIQQTTFLDLSKLGPITLEGIELFTNVWKLRCNYNSLRKLPKLPDSVTHLECFGNNLMVLNNLPKDLKYLDCSNNNLTSIQLPERLTYLNCRKNYLSKLPKLPPKLERLNCQFNMLKTLPKLPKSLISVHCNGNNLEKLQSLNLGSKYSVEKRPHAYFLELNINTRLIETGRNSVLVYKRKFGKVKTLKDVLGEINPNYIIEGRINEEVVKFVTALDVSNKGLTSLKGIEYFKNLTKLNCSYNLLKKLPPLNTYLHELDCQNNNLKELPNLGARCWILNCSRNKLKALPTLSSEMTWLNCSHNSLKKLPILGDYVFRLNCSNNLIRQTPLIPKRVRYLNCSNNPFKNAPILPEEFDIKNFLTL